MTDPYHPPGSLDISVGQRRITVQQNWPTRGPEGGEEPTEVPDMGDPEYNPQPVGDPCADEVRRLEWDLDAAAAEAYRRFIIDAGNDPLLDGRERCMVLIRNPVTGDVTPEQLDVGPLGSGHCTFDPGTFGWQNVVGLIHSHPGSGPVPSSADRDNLAAWQGLVYANNGPQTGLRFYVVGAGEDAPGGASRMQIRVYDQSNIAAGADNVKGPEVNPNGIPCHQP